MHVLSRQPVLSTLMHLGERAKCPPLALSACQQQHEGGAKCGAGPQGPLDYFLITFHTLYFYCPHSLLITFCTPFFTDCTSILITFCTSLIANFSLFFLFFAPLFCFSNWDSSCFSSEIAWHRYQDNIQLRNILPERNVELGPGMFDEFLQELQRHRWDQVLTRLPEKQIDVALVKEFYSNFWRRRS